MAFVKQWLPIVLIAFVMAFLAMYAANHVAALGKLVAKAG